MLRSGSQVTETTKSIPALARQPGRTIELPPPECTILGIVVISDLECEADWEQIAETYLQAGNGQTLYQVVDLTELRSLVGRAQDPMQFITNVILRWAKVHETRTMAIRVRIRRE